MKKFALIGYPLSHTMSPFIHKELFKLSKFDGEYSVLEISPDMLQDSKEELLKLDGFNVTIPHKYNVIPLLDGLNETALKYMSVNTVLCNDKLIGFNTDVNGFLVTLNELCKTHGKNAIFIGAGGVARMAVRELCDLGYVVTVLIREEFIHEAKSLKGDILKAKNDAKINILTSEDGIEKTDLLINATPVGMFPHINECPASDRLIGCSEHVFDMIYNPCETELIKKARALGKPALNGMGMLVNQAAAAHEIWYGGVFDKEDIRKLCVKTNEFMER